MSVIAVGDVVVIAVGSLEGATATVERIEARRHGRLSYWIRVDPLFPDSLAGRRLSYWRGELDSLHVVGNS